MSFVTRGGTVVAAVRSYRADALIACETISAIGATSKGGRILNVEGAYVMPGLYPHIHLEMPFISKTRSFSI